MSIRVEESTIEEIEAKLEGIATDLSKIAYLESALKVVSTYEIKRAVYDKLVELYEGMKMFDKAGKLMSNRAGIDVSFPDKIESYIKAAELYVKAGKAEDADEMFVRAARNANFEQKQKIRLARKNLFLIQAHELEKKGRNASAMKFYEKLIKMQLDNIEKNEIKDKLIVTYRALGKIREAELLEGV